MGNPTLYKTLRIAVLKKHQRLLDARPVRPRCSGPGQGDRGAGAMAPPHRELERLTDIQMKLNAADSKFTESYSITSYCIKMIYGLPFRAKSCSGHGAW